MLKDITLGQYFPIDSVLHKLDARTKILLLIFNIVVIFMAKSFYSYGLIVLFTIFLIKLSKVPVKTYFKGLKPILFIIVFTAILNLFLTDGRDLPVFGYSIGITVEGAIMAVKMALRLVLLIILSSVLTYTTSPMALTDGIEKLLKPLSKLGFPSHELAMMMSIAIRFIPTLIEETDKIIKAQQARGANFDNGSLLKRAKALIPMLVPLFISAFRRADELAIAMESRCYRGGDFRTRLKELHFTKRDLGGLFVFLIFFGVVLTLDFLI
ncbi:MAG: energy-coupling factor transporter transmembrane protein EcfT [Clostridia bacterium]|nr:energy-coupling factor transporter transmembrane protein EcfT [Clostridia bacterium]